MSIRENWKIFQDDLEAASMKYGRSVSDITVMAVSKTRSVDEISAAGEAGLTLFGENRVEEASEKFSALDSESYPLFLIGHLQSNKVSRIGARFAGVHSVDSMKIAKRLSAHRKEEERPLEILLQVNTSGESSKSGFTDLNSFVEESQEIAELPFLHLRGLMTMAPFVDDERVVRDCFAECREWSERISHLIEGGLILSMGMSSDYPWAVAEGSTMIRIGTSIFGARE